MEINKSLSVGELTPPSLITRVLASRFLKEGAFSAASVRNDFFSVSQARYTAVPSVEVVVEPPCVGPGGRSESPNLNEILFNGSIKFSAAILVIAVVVPGPISLTALCKTRFPSACNIARTDACDRPAPNTPFAMP